MRKQMHVLQILLPEAMGLFLVLSTSLSKFLSAISLTIQPADRISIEPERKSAE
jgi:hypothetical protein